MALDVSVLLPNNLRSGYLQSEFISSGLAYTTNKYSTDPALNNNKNQLVIGFELRDKETREISPLKRIRTLYISNDPNFEATATVTINNWPDLGSEFNSDYNYNYNLNSSYFFDNTLSQGSIGSTESGTGLFKINNWPLSANGGLSRVYIKAIIEGPGKQEVEYPNGYGIFDTIFWEGELPTSPSNLNFTANKTGWIGKNIIGSFSHASSFSQDYSDGIGSYIVSKYEIASTGNTVDIFSSRNSNTYRNILPNASIANTSYLSYKFYRSSNVSNYSSFSYNLDEDITLGSSSFDQGVFFYSNSKILSSNSKSDFITQAAFAFTSGSIGATSSLFLKLYDKPDTTSNSKEITLRIDLPHNSYPTAYLYTIENNIESSNKQITTLPNSMSPLLKSGGILELAYSGIGTSYALVESYFTPDSETNKSYLLANSLISSFGQTALGAAFGYQVDSYSSEINRIKLKELALINSKNELGLDLGDCSSSNNYISSPIVKITNTWTTSLNNDYVILYDKLPSLSITNTVNSSYIEVNKIDSSNIYPNPAIYEAQFLKPSLSKNCSVEVKYLHKSDDFYVAFSPISSYRPKTINGFRIEWDRNFASRCIDSYAFSNNPVDAPTIVVKFSQNQNNIMVLQRNADNTFSKQTIKTYSPSNTFDRYLIEISDQMPSQINGVKNSQSSNGTWIYIKKINGNNLDLVGFAKLNLDLTKNSSGLGYYAACGFIKSPYDATASTTFNKIYEFILKPLKVYDKFDDDSLKVFNLSPESLSDDKIYLGQNLLSGNTDFVSFDYKNPISSTSKIEVSAVSNGTNIDISSLSNSTIDGVNLTTLANDSYVILKDQINESENGLYKKISSGSFQLQTSATDTPYEVVSGNVNLYSTFYKIQTKVGNVLNNRFVSTSYFCQMNIDQISNFISTIKPSLFEFKMNYLDFDNSIDFDSVKVRFYSNLNDLPDYDNPLTNWLSIVYKPLYDSYTIQPNSSLIQVILSDSQKNNFNVSQGNKIWVQIILPFNTSLGTSNGPKFAEEYILDGKFTNYKLAQNLWHKLFASYSVKKNNLVHNAYQYLRLRSKSHGKLESHSTNLVGGVKVDIQGPKHLEDKPLIENISETTTRSVQLNILASDDDSGIMSFRVGREIDNFRIQYTPWMSWSQFTVQENGLYTIYLYGNLSYYNSGAGNTVFELQNTNFSGARKIWVQLMDFAGNISESYPLTFVTQSWNLVDTQAPIGSVNFYNTNTYQDTRITNLIKPILRLSADDIVSGVKDFKYRQIKDTGPEEWSEWEYFTNYKNLDFSSENDGVKKIEVVYRDYGNNFTQPEFKWEKVERPKK